MPLAQRIRCLINVWNRSRRLLYGLNLLRSIRNISFLLQTDACLKILRNGVQRESSHIHHPLPGDHGVTARIRNRIAQNIHLAGNEVLFIRDSLLCIQIELEQIRVIETLRCLNQSQFKGWIISSLRRSRHSPFSSI